MAKRLNLGPEIERYTQILVNDPNSLAFVPLADAYRKSGLYEESFAVLKRGMTRRPDYLPAQIVLGKCYLDLGNHSKAESTFKAVLRTDPDNLVALQSLAQLRKNQHRFGEAATVYRHILELDPSNGLAREQLERLESPGGKQQREDVIEVDLGAPAPASRPPEEPIPNADEPETTGLDFDSVMREGETHQEPPPAEAPPVAPTPEPSPEPELDLEAVPAEPVETTETAEEPPGSAVEEAPRGRIEPEVSTDDLIIDDTPTEPASETETADLDIDIENEFADDYPAPATAGPMAESATEPSVQRTPEKAGDEAEPEIDIERELTGGEPPVREDPDEPEGQEKPEKVEAAEEDDVELDAPVPPPPKEDELPVDEHPTEVMDEEDLPPVQPPVKDEIPQVDGLANPNKGAFTNWLSELAESEDEKQPPENKES